MRSIHSSSLIIITLFASAYIGIDQSIADTSTKGVESNGCSSCSIRGNQTNRKGASAAAIANGLGIILQSIPNTEVDIEADIKKNAREYREKINRADRRAASIEKNTSGSSFANPWAQNRNAPKKDTDTGRAPYADSKCAQIKPRANRGKIDWDSVAITNTCKFPIEVIACYYDKGAENKCTFSNTGAWGSPGRIQPGGKIASVSDTRTPLWKVKYVVCNMSGVKNHSKLCLLPKG
ncbi:hypothetical protein F9K94_21130 [Brucella tritici]|uniref:Uncharacterized protein n=1 Tax=Brucella tritici TaxID=94626 RepID=A0A7V7VR00_9HYPH|nr:hypothetical protein [Brucella tritici]KAB2655063.1 hypothetical protein F9K94_21130 [Brucella tritici]